MAITHTFKGSASGYGYSAYIEDGELVIHYESPHEGGEVFRGTREEFGSSKILNVLNRENKKLYNSINKYYVDEAVFECIMAERLKELGWDEETRTRRFKVKLYMTNHDVYSCLVRGRSEADVINKLMPKIPEVLTIQTYDANVFAVRSENISAIEFVED